MEQAKHYTKLKNSFSNFDNITLDELTELKSEKESSIETEVKSENNKNTNKNDKMQCLLIGKQS